MESPIVDDRSLALPGKSQPISRRAGLGNDRRRRGKGRQGQKGQDTSKRSTGILPVSGFGHGRDARAPFWSPCVPTTGTRQTTGGLEMANPHGVPDICEICEICGFHVNVCLDGKMMDLNGEGNSGTTNDTMTEGKGLIIDRNCGRNALMNVDGKGSLHDSSC
jgi:hypothetical protein